MDSELRKRRQLAYLFNEWDDKQESHVDEQADDEKIVLAVAYFFKHGSLLIQPYKSYFVAIVYARCMERYFGKNFWECLDDRELLFDDMYYDRYTDNPEVYHKIVDLIPDIWQYSSIESTVNYFKKEFLVEDDEQVEHK